VASAITIGLTLAQTVQPLEPGDRSASSSAAQEPLVSIAENGIRYVVHPGKLVDCGPPKDGIPSIDDPSFVSVEAADAWIADDELIVTLSYEGETRAYPLQVLVWHEIVNDVIAGAPILVSYCPLCGSGMAYVREIDGAPVAFGTSGKLYNSNLVMYDRATGTYWTQMDGLAIVGERSGDHLEVLPMDTAVWGTWKDSNASALVLSKETGHDRPYGHEPYGNYNKDSYIWFPVENRDNRTHPKTPIIGIEINGASNAYPVESIEARGFIEDRVGGMRIRIEQDVDGRIRVICPATGEHFPSQRSFWFAWVAFHPNTEIFLDPSS